MKGNTIRAALALACLLFCFCCNAAPAQERPAVSGLNGKFDFSAGVLTLPAPTFVGRAAGALTVPLGNRFGLQADFSASTAPGFTTSAALHLFARDPSTFLLGGSVGIVRSPGALVIAAGPEAELYRDRWSVEAWAGASIVDPVGPGPMRLGVFGLGGLAYYPTDNWRVSAGISWLDGYAAAQIGSEYLLDNFRLPMAITGEARLGQDGAIRATVGWRSYFGPDPRKSLIDRQREDDPVDLGTALYAAAGRSRLYGDVGSRPEEATSGVVADAETADPEESDPQPTPNPDWCLAPLYAWDPSGHCYSNDTFEEYFGA